MRQNNDMMWTVGMIIILFAFFGYIIVRSAIPTKAEEERSLTEQMIIDRKGSPLLVSSHRIGDDVEPKFARTYCQLLPFKRSVEDDQIYCYTVVE